MNNLIDPFAVYYAGRHLFLRFAACELDINRHSNRVSRLANTFPEHNIALKVSVRPRILR